MQVSLITFIKKKYNYIMDISINISNHPQLPDVKRRVHYKSIFIDKDNERIVLNVTVKHYNANDELLSGSIYDKDVEMIASNNSKVDNEGNVVNRFQLDPATGQPVLDENNKRIPVPGWQTANPEYDFLNAIAESGPIDIYDLIANTMTKRAQANRFDWIYNH